MAITVRGSMWSTPLALGSSMEAPHLTIIPAAERHSASKSVSTDHPKMWSTHMRGKGVTVAENTVLILVRSGTMKTTIIDPNIGS
jgi:hypothetical protein